MIALQRLQDLEESRINSMTSLYKECVDTERKVMPIVSKCIDGMEKASNLVSSSTVRLMLIRTFQGIAELLKYQIRLCSDEKMLHTKQILK